MRVLTVPSKSSLKLMLIQSIDRQIALDALAESNGMEINELLNEIESIVYSGTKINIQYYIDQTMDEDVQEEIEDYFRNSDTDRLSVAKEVLGPEYKEEEIRLIRIKFMSEMGN